MRVKSAVDWWWGGLVIGVAVLLLVSAAIVPQEGRLGIFAAVLPVVALILWMILGTYYEFHDEHLFCRCGPFFERIPYDKIKSARLTRNLLSSMALSSRRIEIRQHGKGYFTGTTMISPVNKEDFLQELLRRCPNLDQGTQTRSQR